MSIADPALARQVPQAAARRAREPDDRSFVATGAYSVGSRASLAALAAAGQLPPELDALRVEGWAAAGDGGAASYVWQASAPSHSLYVADSGPRGGYWVLAERVATLAMAGMLGGPLGADPSTDDRAAFVALLAYGTALGSLTIAMPMRRFRLSASVTTIPYLRIMCEPWASTDPKVSAGASADPRDQPGFVLDSGVTLYVERHNWWSDFSVSRPGLVPVSTIAEALARQASLLDGGDLIARAVGGPARRGIKLERINPWGGNRGIVMSVVPGAKLLGIYGDCGTSLIDMSNCGERIAIKDDVKQKPMLTASTEDVETIGISAIADNGSGKMRVTASSNITTAGLTTGQRIASDKIVGVSGSRWTVTVIDSTHFDLLDVTWASQTLLSGADFSFNPGGSSGVTALLSDGGYLRVQTIAAMPFLANQYAVIGLGDIDGEGFYKVRTVTSTTDFTLDVAATAPMLAATLADCELCAMPGNRFGYALKMVDTDGADLDGTSKGGSGVYCDSSNVKMTWSHEGGVVGELDLADRNSVGLYLGPAAQRFIQLGGAWKSTGTGMRMDMPNAVAARVKFIGVEFNDGGYASMDIISGGAQFFDPTGRGERRVRLASGIGASFFDGGEFTYENLIGSNIDKQRIDIAGAPSPDGDRSIREHIVGKRRFYSWQAGVPFLAVEIGPIGAQIQLPGPYADDAAATTAGVLPGEAYRTPSDVVWHGAGASASTPPLLIGATSGTTAKALTTSGAATSGTASGYSIATNRTAKRLRIDIIAQRNNGVGTGTNSECAMWVLDVLMSRGTGVTSTAVKRTAGLSSIAPTEYYDASGTEPSAWTVTLTTSNASLVCNVLGASGANIDWTAQITEVAVTVAPASPSSYRLLNAGGKRLLNAGGYRLKNA